MLNKSHQVGLGLCVTLLGLAITLGLLLADGSAKARATSTGSVNSLATTNLAVPAGNGYQFSANAAHPDVPQQGTPTPTVTGTPPTATRTRTATITLTPSATPCDTGAIVNGGFETGALTPWTVLGTNPAPVVSTALVHSGTYSALLGSPSGPEPIGDGSIYQTITVPASGGTLSFWWNGSTTDTITYDWQDAYVTNTSGTILATIFHNCTTTGGWLNQHFDMAAYAGQTVRIEFLVHQDGFGDDTSMYVDDVALYNACSTVTPTSTPTQVLPTPTACSIQFTDVPVGSTFYAFIRCLACRNIINGYADGSFKPGNNVTRGQLSKIVSNAAGFIDPQTTQMFQDVPPTGPGSTFFVYIGRLASRGYIGGYPCGGPGEPCIPPNNLPYFRPNANATRGQISKIVSNAAGFEDTPTGQQFQDVPVGSTYYTYTYRLVSRGVMSGYPCGTPPAGPCVPPANLPYFRPNNNATRGQTSKIVANTFFPDCETPRAATK